MSPIESSVLAAVKQGLESVLSSETPAIQAFLDAQVSKLETLIGSPLATGIIDGFKATAEKDLLALISSLVDKIPTA